MAIRFNCSCGVLLEVDDSLTGQQINCPDCQRAMRIPTLERLPQRTSGLALASLILALVGAFTIVGTVAAVVLGAIALLTISRHRDRLTGEAFAVAGILLGIVLTGMSLFAYSSVELFGLSSAIREFQWAQKLDYEEPLERPIAAEYSITRPSAEWGVYRPEFHFDRFDDNLILVNVRKDAFATCVWVFLNRPGNLDFIQTEALDQLERSELFRLLMRGGFSGKPKVEGKKVLPSRDGMEITELQVSLKLGRRNRKFLVHLARNRDDLKVYIIAGGARAEQFEDNEPELRQILESFKIHK